MHKVVYLGHSGFIVKLNNVNLIFDYFKGEIPPLDKEKNLIIFSSHSHNDHFNPEIFSIFQDYSNVLYIFSSDIQILRRDGSVKYDNVSEDILKNIHFMKPYENYDVEICQEVLSIHTFKSTDKGVAFILKLNDFLIYHGGDLNDWYWKDESKQYNNNIKALYSQEIDKIKAYLKGKRINIAFLPLDSRQENECYRGMQKFLDNIEVIEIYPMHLWEKYEYIDFYINKFGKNKNIIKLNDNV